MSRRRDRHDRGMRGPLMARTPAGHLLVASRRNLSANAWFAECLTTSLARISQLDASLLDHIDIGIEEVPTVRDLDDRVPLAAAIEASPTQPARVVVYRRPLELRATSRTLLRRLVHRTVVEQLSALTGRSITDIDPLVRDEDDD